MGKVEERKRPELKAEVYERAARHIYKRRRFDASMISDTPIRDVIKATHEVITQGLKQGLEYEVPEEVLYALDNNAYVFCGFKAYNSLREVGLALTTDEGEIKPYQQFLAEVRQIDAKYNRHYLEAEYDHAVGSAMMASKWVNQAGRGDKYYLQYRTAADSAVRPAHQRLEGITLPSSDPFWESYYPPNGWRCRCDVVEVLREDYKPTDSEEASKLGDTVLTTNKERMFAFNPGKELRLYPDKHPYYGKRGIAHCGISQHASGNKDGSGKECELLSRILEAKDDPKRHPLTPEQKAYRKQLQQEARDKHAGTIVTNQIPIKITSAGIKEFLNQPHEHYFEKNELVKDLPKLIREAKYIGEIEGKPGRTNILATYALEVEIKGDKSWLIALKTSEGDIVLHSISDNLVLDKKR